MSRDGAPSRGAWAQPSGSCAAVKLWCSRPWERPVGHCDVSSAVASLALPWAGRLNFSSCPSSMLQAPSSVLWLPSSVLHARIAGVASMSCLLDRRAVAHRVPADVTEAPLPLLASLALQLLIQLLLLPLIICRLGFRLAC